MWKSQTLIEFQHNISSLSYSSSSVSMQLQVFELNTRPTGQNSGWQKHLQVFGSRTPKPVHLGQSHVHVSGLIFLGDKQYGLLMLQLHLQVFPLRVMCRLLPQYVALQPQHVVGLITLGGLHSALDKLHSHWHDSVLKTNRGFIPQFFGSHVVEESKKTS